LEKRKIVRYKLCLPVVFKWTDDNGLERQEAGFTRDISTGGLYVSCPKCPPINTTLLLEIVLPSKGEALSGGLRLGATATIVRLATKIEEKGFAAVGELVMPQMHHHDNGNIVDTKAFSRES
jgi:hypothetical protein